MGSNRVAALVMALGRAIQRLLRPARSGAALVIGATGDLSRTRSELLAENALFRQQVIVLRRRIGRPRLHRSERQPRRVLRDLLPIVLIQELATGREDGAASRADTSLARH